MKLSTVNLLLRFCLWGAVSTGLVLLAESCDPTKPQPKPSPSTRLVEVRTFVVNEMFVCAEGNDRVGVSTDGWVCYKLGDEAHCHRSIPAPEIPNV